MEKVLRSVLYWCKILKCCESINTDSTRSLKGFVLKLLICWGILERFNMQEKWCRTVFRQKKSLLDFEKMNHHIVLVCNCLSGNAHELEKKRRNYLKRCSSWSKWTDTFAANWIKHYNRGQWKKRNQRWCWDIALNYLLLTIRFFWWICCIELKDSNRWIYKHYFRV